MKRILIMDYYESIPAREAAKYDIVVQRLEEDSVKCNILRNRWSENGTTVKLKDVIYLGEG